MMIMFLCFLKYSYGSHELAREGALWHDDGPRPKDLRHTYRLGFRVTLAQYGYGWFLLIKIDWTRFAFRTELRGRNLFRNVRMAKRYKQR